MKYRTERSRGFESFDDFPVMLEDARRLGTDVIYLVDFWEPDYEHKADYRPKEKWGGAEAFRRGIERVHARGGRVICYLEAFIISRDTDLARGDGRDFAMMDDQGHYYAYYDTRDRFYLMQPGEGSGWTDHLVAVAGRLAREYRIDGVHLDSYGLQWNWRDHNPLRPAAKDPAVFNRGAVELVRRVRAELRKHVPDAVVILEGAERTELLDVCDGAQIESLPVLRRKPWHDAGRYPIYTSSFELEEMRAILDAGHNLALSPWWFDNTISDRERRRLLGPTDKNSRFDQLMTLHKLHNILLANDLLPEQRADFARLFDGIIEELNRRQWRGEFGFAPLRQAAERYLRTYDASRGVISRTPADMIRDMLGRPRDENTASRTAP